jgi:glycosyltransferase involved in cell wall biosynthesis
MGKLRVVHIINSLSFGGAEAMLCALLSRTDREDFDPYVICLINDTKLAAPVKALGIPIATMGMRPNVPDPRGPVRLVRHLRKLKPDLVQTWMDHSNLIGGVAARMASAAKVVWGIHHSHHVPGLTKRSTLMTVAACARLSRRVPDRIVCCSEHAQKLYNASGFAPQRMTVIPNGFDTDLFRPDNEARLAIRQEMGLGPDAVLIGLVARYDPFKDHANFIMAAGIVAKQFPNVHFVMCGNGVDTNNATLSALIVAQGLTGRAHMLGQRKDVARIHAALDIAASSSITEAFPLAVGEAMSCGVPCVATNVGDSAMMIGSAGIIVPPSDSQALADGWAKLLRLDSSERQQLGAEARKRVRELFDLVAVTHRYESLYRELVGAEPSSPVPARPPRPAASVA